jgi:hypothetical protein
MSDFVGRGREDYVDQTTALSAKRLKRRRISPRRRRWRAVASFLFGNHCLEIDCAIVRASGRVSTFCKFALFDPKASNRYRARQIISANCARRRSSPFFASATGAHGVSPKVWQPLNMQTPQRQLHDAWNDVSFRISNSPQPHPKFQRTNLERDSPARARDK